MRAIILFPLSLCWGGLAQCRRWAYALGLLTRHRPAIPSVVVGNLSMGGSGKTPFAMLILRRLLEQGHTPAYISRGYGRHTRGLIEVHTGHTASEVGDEALMVKARLPQVAVVVGEQRKKAVEYLINSKGEISYLVFDDGYQHLALHAHKYLLLTPYQKPFYSDRVFPMGSLREWPRHASLAQALVFAKCPEGQGREQLLPKMPEWLRDKVMLFSNIVYQANLVPLNTGQELAVGPNVEVLAFAGTASNQVFFKEISRHMRLEWCRGFRDHQGYQASDLKEIVGNFEALRAQKPGLIALTTEKDAARLHGHPHGYLLSGIPLYYWPIDASLGTNDYKLLDNILLNQ